MKTEHTPGPWYCTLKRDGVDHPITDATAYQIALVDGHYAAHGRSIANARLIAAAPDLLATCEEALACIDGPCELGDMLAATIAKAKGEQE